MSTPHVICGIDEAGRGPVLGPLVIAAVAAEDDLHLKEVHVKDSKQLTRKKREELSPLIRECSEVETLVVSAEENDFYRLTGSLNDLEAESFAKLLKKLRPDEAYADAADVNEERFASVILQNLDFKLNLVSKHKADTLFPIVSAASVIAKTLRDELVDAISAEFGVPVGSGYPGDEVTRKFIEDWVRKNGTFPPHTRTSWKTAKEIYSKAKITKITDWID